jgi:hypothetical protein
MATRGLVNCCSSDGLSEEPAEQGLPRASCYEFLLSGCTKTSESVYGFDRNGCTEWLGIRNTWLEQGRSITASAHVIDALARGLRLDRENHRHLRHLAGLPTPEPDQMPEGATPELTRLLAALVPAPACLLGQRFDFVAWNETFAALWDPGGLPEGRRNLMWLTFADPIHRRRWVDWDDRSRILLAQFRAAAGRHAGDALFNELIDALRAASPEFRALWPHYLVKQSITGPISIRHPTAGIIKLDVIELGVSAHPSLTLVVQIPVRPVDRKKLATFL